MIQKRQIFIAAVAAIFLSSSLLSCINQENEVELTEAETSVAFSLTGNPGSFEAVYLDIRQVEVVTEGKEAKLFTPFRPGVYDMKKFSNGRDTLLLTALLSTNKISRIRLILGSDNSVRKEGNLYALNMPSVEESVVELNINENFAINTNNTIWLNFNAEKSIIKNSGSEYHFKPMIRAYTRTTDGRISGYVGPLESEPVVYLTNGTETFSTTPDFNGYYLITGVPGGNYSLNFNPGNLTYSDTTINNIQVSYGDPVAVGDINLKQ